ncbi:MAG: radical SAM protein [Candidatus Micrarchaeota archaeon]
MRAKKKSETKSVLLVVPPETEVKDVKQTGSKWPRIGIAYLAGYLRKNGVSVSVLDCKAEGINHREVEERIARASPGIVGVTSFTEEILSAAEVCNRAKKVRKDITTVIGGPHASAIPKQTLEEFQNIDVVVCGEGEQTIYELASGKPLKEVKGIFFRKRGEISPTRPRAVIAGIDSIPMPAWDLFPLDRYRGILTERLREETASRELELPVLSARGCPFKCNFCYKVYGSTLRLRDPKKVVDEIEYDIENYGATHFFFVEGTFGINKKWGVELCDEIIKRGLNKKISWVAETRVDATEELLKKMKEAGCKSIGFGVESGDPEILARSGKGITLDMVRRTIGLAKKIGFAVECYFIFGHPNETRESIEKTIRLAEELDPDLFNVGIMIPYPGTGVRALAEQGFGGYHLLCHDWSEYTKQRGGPLELKEIPIGELRKLQARAYMRFYMRPHRMIKILRTLPPSKIMKISLDLLKTSLGLGRNE